MTVGRKPKPTVLRIIGGNAGHRPLPENEPVPEGAAVKPKNYMTKRASEIWDEEITRAHWLTWADSRSAAIMCELIAEWESKSWEFPASRIGQFRALANELGFNPSARARLGTTLKGHRGNQAPTPEAAGQSKASKYFRT